MSIAEFLDGLPSHDKRNFSSFISKNYHNKSTPVYITTKDNPSIPIINIDNDNSRFEILHKQWDKKNGHTKKTLVETSEESASTSTGRPRVDPVE